MRGLLNVQDVVRTAVLAPPHAAGMATNAVLTVDDVLGELDEEYEGDSEYDFEGCVDMEDGLAEEETGDNLDVGANVELGGGTNESDSDFDEDDDAVTLPEYTLVAVCAVPVEGNRPLDYLSLLLTDDILGNIVVALALTSMLISS